MAPLLRARRALDVSVSTMAAAGGRSFSLSRSSKLDAELRAPRSEYLSRSERMGGIPERNGYKLATPREFEFESSSSQFFTLFRGSSSYFFQAEFSSFGVFI